MIDLKSAFEAMWNRNDAADNQDSKVGDQPEKLEEKIFKDENDERENNRYRKPNNYTWFLGKKWKRGNSCCNQGKKI